ncbi:hypothetical protein SAMN05421805_10471 [Saccharopolyspora antimicrobica]|uniref:Uncharacterized protein n=1 Tax=Saccharopolyspora antimicrobica TaxID=455193 RepID=A0A1I4YD58_9PSEU|nr:hypothetical protein [Saccharopolyspora antimicrobica]RKT82604.1 hypothetical protein ATL45_0856 [Saccharopolyspora antimicrobica]SFN35509.1 hypothetical protein SAMN05421805_10471 [Saccharopolyspora antimicrobica]
MRRSPVLFSIAAALTAFAIAPAVPAIAAPEQAPACALFAYQPTREGNTLVANGGRTGCLNTATVNVRIVVSQKDAAPKVIGELAQSGTEINLTTKAPCNTGATVEVYTETVSSTGATYRSSSTTFEKC